MSRLGELPYCIAHFHPCTYTAAGHRHVTTFHICSGNFPILTIIKIKNEGTTWLKETVGSPPHPCWQYQWSRPLLTSIYPALLKPPWCQIPRTAAGRLSSASLPSLLQNFFLTSNLHFPCCNLLLFIQLTADGSKASPLPPAGFYTFHRSRSLVKRPSDSLHYFNLLSYILFSKFLIVLVVNLCPSLYFSWRAVPWSGHTKTPAESLLVPATSKLLNPVSYMQRFTSSNSSSCKSTSLLTCF